MNGQTVAQAAAIISTTLSSYLTPADFVFLNWGVNDYVGGLPDETTWKTNYLTILDALHAKWPGALVYLTKPWMRGKDAEAATMAGWVDDLVAARPTFARVGVDESVTIKGSDNGESETVDGVHYSALGASLYAAAMLAAITGV